MKAPMLIAALACLVWCTGNAQARQLRQYFVYLPQQGESCSIGDVGRQGMRCTEVALIEQQSLLRRFRYREAVHNMRKQLQQHEA
jgi:hypothetical protein